MDTSLTLAPEWEYRDFIYQDWIPDQAWSCLEGADEPTQTYAQFALWKSIQEEVAVELDRWRLDGWEPISEIGPQGLKIYRTDRIGPPIDVADIALWLLTAGVALLVYLFVGGAPRTYSTYRPAEFRVRVRRPR